MPRTKFVVEQTEPEEELSWVDSYHWCQRDGQHHGFRIRIDVCQHSFAKGTCPVFCEHNLYDANHKTKRSRRTR